MEQCLYHLSNSKTSQSFLISDSVSLESKKLEYNPFDLLQVAAENSAGVGVFSDPFLFQTAESGNFPKSFILS